LDEQIRSLNELTSQKCFLETVPYPVPRLVDLLPIQRVEEMRKSEFELAPRKYDEKFQILQAPEHFLPDLEKYRKMTDLRGTCTSVAFIDIDDFKAFNTRYNETKIDRNLLPSFMRLVEAHLRFQGQAYRQGGDEYLITLPGSSREFALMLLDELRREIANLRYRDIEETLTVSIGLCTADADCYLTNRELQDRANRAKQFAKSAGKDRIATYRGNAFRQEDLDIARPINAHAEQSS
jgi:diguanylate cyclase (GGDEF)-like protein